MVTGLPGWAGWRRYLGGESMGLISNEVDCPPDQEPVRIGLSGIPDAPIGPLVLVQHDDLVVIRVEERIWLRVQNG